MFIGFPIRYVRPVALSSAMLAATAAAPSAWAGTCLEQVHGFAAKYDIKVDPPDAGRVPSTPLPAPEDLSRSGGVIEPTPRRSPAVIEPPTGADPRMTTLPDVPPMVKGETGGDPRRLSTVDRAALKATLMAARAEALRGQEKDCFARLEKAKTIVLPAQ